jgi:hypothetical protein
MLPSNAWRQEEPRLNFPVFAGIENHIDFTLQDDPPLTMRRLVAPVYHFVKSRKTLATLVKDYRHFIGGEPYRFKAIYLNRQGHLLYIGDFEGQYRPGGFFHCNLGLWLATQGMALQDGNLVLVASRGRADRFLSSPGNVTLRVIGPNRVCGYRTGFFSRPLNAGHKHFGFTGLNPHVEVNGDWISSLLLINHSSDPEYDKRVNPTVRLYRADGAHLEAPFGEIAPHAALERNLLELFPDVQAFLAASGGRGYTITRLKGASLASIHVQRSRDGELASMEHSRPAHPNVVDYL